MELNVPGPRRTKWECGYCGCFFQDPGGLDKHVWKIHLDKLATKRKLKCCGRNRKKLYKCCYCGCSLQNQVKFVEHVQIHEKKLVAKRKLQLHCCGNYVTKRHKHKFWSCHYCECVFRDASSQQGHISNVHKCPKCHEFILTDDLCAQHKIKHDKEEELKMQQKLKEQQRQLEIEQECDNFVLNYVKTNKLDEYQLRPDCKLDFSYIFSDRFDLEKEELLAIVKKFDIDILSADLYDCHERFLNGGEKIIYLLENGALSVESDSFLSWMDNLTYRIDATIINDMVEYFLDKDYEIKPNWVAAVASHIFERDEVIERIKEKYTFTFDEIYEAGYECHLENPDRREFYRNIHKHFPNPDFPDPNFPDPDLIDEDSDSY